MSATRENQDSSGVHSTETPSVANESPANTDVAIDHDLLKRAVRGDNKAFHALMDRHAPRLYRLAVSLVGNSTDAEDVLQEAFTGVYRGMGKFEGRSSVKTWITRIVFTQAAKFHRDRAGKSMAPLVFDHASEDTGSSHLEAKEELDAALAKLSPEHREILVLRELEGMSYEEMALVLGVPRGTIESRLHRARNDLREKLLDQERSGPRK